MTLSLHNISKSFGPLNVLRNFSATMESGQIYCLMGPSGSGKTTLLRLLMGLETADSGQIEGLETARISVVFQDERLCEAFTPVENVMMAADRKLTQAQAKRELCRLLPEESLKRPVSTLSGGMKRRTAICRALLAPFELLLMDEPFTGLDEDAKSQAILYIQEKCAKKLVLLTTHQEQDVQALGGRLIRLPSIGGSA